jgi:hypothetical protein
MLGGDRLTETRGFLKNTKQGNIRSFKRKRGKGTGGENTSADTKKGELKL